MNFSPAEKQSTDYELEKLDYYLLEIINPSSNSFKSNFSDDQNVISEICNELKTIYNKLQIKLFKTSSEEASMLTVKNYQKKLSFYINSISEYLLYCDKEGLTISVENYIRIQTKLAEIISIIEKYFGEYFDYKALANSIYKQDVFEQLQEMIKSISFPENIKENKLFEIAFKPTFQFLTDYNIKGYSYSQVKRVYQITQSLVSYDFNENNFEESFCKWLISINFNYALFFSYLTTLHQEKLNNHARIGDRINYLSSRIKVYNQIEHTIEPGLFLEERSIKSQITSWIYEEIEHIQHLNISSQINNEELKFESSLEKIQLNLSVSEIAFILRALVDSKIIESASNKVIFSTISKVFKSKKREVISEGSLRSKFFSVNLEMKETGKDISIRMLNYFNSLPHI